MIPYITVKTYNPAVFYNEFGISEENFNELLSMTEEGFENEALDMFIEEYLYPASEKYEQTMREYLYGINSGPMRIKDHDALIRNISLLTLGLISFLGSNFNKYIKDIYIKTAFKQAGVDDSQLKKTILNEVISEYDRLISSTFSDSQSFITNSIRTFQREMIAENLLIKNSKIEGAILENEILRFKDSLKIKYPEIYRAMNKGNIITVSRFKGEEQMVRHYKMNYYIDLVTRTTLLNANRNANMVGAMVNSEPVVEYALIDNRSVKKDREICQDILSKKINGLSILALAEDIATKLGIMTVDQAKSTPDFAMGPYCRHGVLRCSSQYLKEIKKLIEAQ